MSVRRQDIVTAITTRFAAIATPTYHNTLSGKVFSFFGKTAVPETIVDVRDVSETVEELSNSVWDRRMTIEIHVEVTGGTSEVSGRELIEDIYKAIGTDRTWSGYAADTVAISDELETDQEERRVTGAKVTIEILYRTSAWAES